MSRGADITSHHDAAFYRMSIPPLVCSSPPPPDQCEEDKDPEDFDVSYNLSQDDEDDGFTFGTFSSYNNVQTSTDVNKENVLHPETLVPSDTAAYIAINLNNETAENKLHSGTNITTASKLKCEEDTNVEDLELEVNVESISSTVKIEGNVDETNGFNLDSSGSDLNVENDILVDHLRTLSPSLTTDENSDSVSLEDKQISEVVTEEESENVLNVSIVEPHDTPSNNNTQDCCEVKSKLEEETNCSVDFGDFDDFQFVNTENKPSPIDNCDNPWDGNETGNDDFGNFTANFEPVKAINTQQFDSEPNKMHREVNMDTIQTFNDEDDDDFGDFDGFKSSAVDNDAVSEESTSQGLGINFQLSDNESQVMESITNVLSSIFEHEVSEPEAEFEGRLETMLSETWRHLRETDIRQPYIVNWNNSLGQKTLLKALCIDSRNILFGPKWGYNMPKYAVNLSNAPLQPQKPLTLSNASSENAPAEKATPKPSGWVDPFTSDGQESCNTETESVVEVTSSDLNVFEAAISTKPQSNKIYSSTLNVQPLRQINLPDTHIFTPTDSETPRSKTIHYESGPSILLPQPVLETTKTVECLPPQNNEVNESIDDEDDWEFQDFRGSSIATATATSSQTKEPVLVQKPEPIAKPNVTYQTQVLQPIKMEPIMPSLNWPDPGEVKETFQDFSDFITKTSWNNDESHIPSPQDSKPTDSVTSQIINDTSKSSIEIGQIEVTQQVTQAKSESFDDEFDMFQSALPTKNSTIEITFNQLTSNTYNNIPNRGSNQSPSIIKDFDYTFPKNSSDKLNTISVDYTKRPNEALTQSLGFIPTPIELTTNKNSLPLGNPMSSNLLQPLPVNSNASQKLQKTAQILQPLSLESYSQINWPNPGIDLQDLSRFNPVETLQSLKTELSASGGNSKGASPVHGQKNVTTNQAPEDDIWGEFVSSKPKQQSLPKKAPVFVDDDEWTDFVSSPSVKSQNGLNTISLNVHTNSNIQKSGNKFVGKINKTPVDIPTLNYITPKSSRHSTYNDRHFQNL